MRHNIPTLDISALSKAMDKDFTKSTIKRFDDLLALKRLKNSMQKD